MVKCLLSFKIRIIKNYPAKSEFMKNLVVKYEEMIRYVIAGGLTTLLNLILFYVMESILEWNYAIANVIAIALSILFAYVINRAFVFKSKSSDLRLILKEFSSFVGLRVGSGLIEMVLLIMTVEWFSWDPFLSKLIIQVIVLMLNYIFSKYIIFRKVGDDNQDA